MLGVERRTVPVASRPLQPSHGVTRATSRARATPAVVLAIIGTGLLAILVLWWSDTPAVHGLGDYLTGAGRILGLMAGYGVVVLVALMARLPPLERGVGADRLARWHAMGGRYVVTVIVAHAVLITWGYAVSAHEGLISEAGMLLLSYPDVLMATVAGLLFVGIGLVSARAARRRMSYDTWYYLHFYTYLAIGLAFSHQFADGAAFAGSLKARFAWSALYVRRRGTGAVVPGGEPGAERAAPPVPRGRRAPRVRRRGLGLHRRPEPERAPGRARAVLPLAVPGPEPVVVLAPVLAVGAAAAGRHADHGQGPRRPQPGPGPAQPGHPGAGRRTVRGVHPRADRPPGAAAGGRGGHHPAAGHVRHAARRR